MIIEISKDALLELTMKQLSGLFSLAEEEVSILQKYFEPTLERVERCFSFVDNKYYRRGEDKRGEVYFNPFHSVQYMCYLYYLSNTIYRSKGSCLICDKLYALNKTLNGLDLLYAVELPDFFSAEHPVGSVLGRAQYGNGFLFLQNCTVGGSREKDGSISYPIIGENVHMYASSMIIGRCKIGDNVKIGAGTIIKNQDVPSNSIVFGASPNLIIK